MIPLTTDRPFRTTPLVNYTLIAINVIIAMLVAVSHPFQQWTEQYCYLRPAAGLLKSFQIASPHVWQYVTYQFLHDPHSVMHLLGNMLFLWVFGNAVEDRLGHWAYLFFYLAGGVFAGIAHVLTTSAPAIGASGAIAAVTGAFLVLFPRTKVRILWFIILISIFEIPSLWFIGFNIALNVYSVIRGGGNVAYMAHIGGYTFGIAVALILLFTRLLVREPYDMMTYLSQWNRRRKFHAVTEHGFDPWRGSRPAGTEKSRGRRKMGGRQSTTDQEIKPNRDSAQVSRKRSLSSPGGGEDAAAGHDAQSGDHADGRPDGGDRSKSSTAKEREPAMQISERDFDVARRREEITRFVEKSESERAVQAVRSFLQMYPESVLSKDVLLSTGNWAFTGGEYEAALNCYRLLLQHYPKEDTHGRIHLLTGLILARYLSRNEESLEFLRFALDRSISDEDRTLARELISEASQNMPP